MFYYAPIMEMIIVTKIGDYYAKGENMEKEQILQQLFSQTKEDKDILLEQLVFCKFANEYDFENYFRIGKLKESDLFCLISFLYHQE